MNRASQAGNRLEAVSEEVSVRLPEAVAADLDQAVDQQASVQGWRILKMTARP